MKKMMVALLAGLVLAATSAGVASAFFHKSLFGGGDSEEASVSTPATSTDVSELTITAAAAAGLVGPGNDGGLGTGLYDFDVILGDLNAPVTITEYASMTCGHCQKFHAADFQPIVDTLIATGKVKFIYRDFPLDNIAFRLAVMGRCLPAEKQPLYVKQIYAQQPTWISDPNNDYFKIPNQIIADLGVSKAELDACVANEELQQKLLSARKEAEGLGVNSTPTIFINNRQYRGDRSIGDITRFINKL